MTYEILKSDFAKSEKRFKYEIDLQNIIYCVFVVMIHLFTAQVLQNDVLFCVQRILFCSIYGFIFLSGFKCFLSKDCGNYIEFYKNRLKKVVILYVIAVFVYVLSYSQIRNTEVDFAKIIIYIIKGDAEAHFYFVIAIIQLYLLTPFLSKAIKNGHEKTVIIFSFIINILAVVFLSGYSFYNRIFVRYLFCYVLGCVCAKNYDNFIIFIKNTKRQIFVAYIVLLVGEIFAAYNLRLGNLSYKFQQIITFFYMPAAILFFYTISLSASQKIDIRKNKVLSIINKNSYHIYLWHILIITLTDEIIKRTYIQNHYAFFVVRIFLSVVFTGVIVAAITITRNLTSQSTAKYSSKTLNN